MIPQRRLHPLSPLLDSFTMAARSWPALIALVLNGSLWRAPVLVGLAALLIGVAMARWAMTSYEVGEDGLFRFRKGVLFRSERVVPLDRIQDVSQLRKLRHRVLGVVALRIETAGGGRESDMVLDFVTVHDAASLAQILGARAGAVAVESDGGEAPGVRLGPGLLALGGITGAQLAAAPVALFGLLNQAEEAPRWLEDGALGMSRAVGEVAVIATLLVLSVAVAAILPIVRYHGFALRRVGGDVAMQRGLFEQRAVTVPLSRVQSVRVVANPVRRLLGLVKVLVDTTARAGGDGNGRAENLGIPILATGDLESTLALLFPDARRAPQLERHPRAARTLAALRALRWLLPVAVAAGAGLWAAVGPWAAPAGVLLLLPAPVVAAASYRLLGHATDGRCLWSRRGLFSVSTEVVVLAKVQGAGLRSSPGQRRRGVCTVVVFLASRQPTVVLDVDAATGTELVRSLTSRPKRPALSWA